MPSLRPCLMGRIDRVPMLKSKHCWYLCESSLLGFIVFAPAVSVAALEEAVDFWSAIDVHQYQEKVECMAFSMPGNGTFPQYVS